MLRKRNAVLESALAKLQPSVAPIADLTGLDENVTIYGTYYNRAYNRHESWSIIVSWREIFSSIAPYLVALPNEEAVRAVLGEALWKKYNSSYGERPSIEGQSLKTVGVQLKALGLVNITYSEAVGGGMGLFWSATPSGDRLTLELRTVRSKTEKPKILPAK